MFDDERNKSQVFHEFSQGNREEIDGIYVYKNLIFLINGYSGDNRSNLDAKHNSILRFRGLDDPTKLKLKVLGKDTAENDAKVADLQTYLENNKKYKFFLKKIVLAPNIQAEHAALWSDMEKDEFLIDKPVFKYLSYCCSQVNSDYGLREFLILLNVKLNQIGRNSSEMSLGRPETDQGHSAIFSEIERGSRCMYSFIVPVKDIIDYIKILRFEAFPESKKNFQRIVDKDRLKIISDNYLYKNESFPSNIILAFEPDIYTDNERQRVITGKNDQTNSVQLFLLKEYGSLIVIDGQHRILSHLKKPDRDLNKKVLVSVIDFHNHTSADSHRAMSDIFVQINNQHKKISPMVMLRINALNEPTSSFARWYQIFKELNKKSPKSYFSDLIEFEDTPMKRFESDDKVRINISSLVKYAGVNGLEKGTKKYNGLLDTGFFQPDQLKDVIKNFFDIIEEITKGTKTQERIVLSPRDIGGLIRLTVHFINDDKTKDAFLNLSIVENKAIIKPYLEKIPFDQLNGLPYGANAWAIMEGYFLGKIRKHYKRFGVTDRLSKKAIVAMKRAKKR